MFRRIIFTPIVFVLSTFVFMSTEISSTLSNGTEDEIDTLITGATHGQETGLPLPRFVSLKTNRTNMRIGPSFDHRISWVFVKPKIPVEIIQEFEVWRYIRDADGEKGWVHRRMLSSERHAIVAPWAPDEYVSVHKQPAESSAKAAKLQSGVYSDILECSNEWCRVKGRNYHGWVKSDLLWGIYPGEAFE